MVFPSLTAAYGAANLQSAFAGSANTGGGDAEDDPDGRRDDRDAGEDIARLGAEGARSAHAAEGAGQTAAASALDEDQQDQEHGDQAQEEPEHSRQNGGNNGKGHVSRSV